MWWLRDAPRSAARRQLSLRICWRLIAETRLRYLSRLDVQDPSDNTRKERWLRVRMNDAENTEGWIEARNVMPEEVLEASRKMAEEDKDVAAQATGQLRASSNLRLYS